MDINKIDLNDLVKSLSDSLGGDKNAEPKKETKKSSNSKNYRALIKININIYTKFKSLLYILIFIFI